ncbi:MBL fold metallo-hydrolase [Clostridium sp. YIM B02515]|uniref:MBL fold metallo-hydrolase n=1 Tax=Clostridium rhizosphaerae TaxID=2803861 RepID=A0ABS1TGY7_9CLOT|nr:MBL fold metallo-hydrolase [Clostridium rhizosphaerae]MBL4938634.1 MBL fold metallo-hydrolase [Clostridium rhizosphaerae]
MKLKLGKNTSKERLRRIKNSPNYRKGRFHNLEGVYDLSDYTSIIRMLKDMFFNKTKRREPPCALPSIKTDLMSLNPNEDIIIWFGHSSWFIQLNGKRFLIDPVLSGSASKIKFFNRSYKGSDIYKVSDIPDIDYLLISHDHYDHLDHEAVAELRPKIKQLIAGLGVGAYFERWGFDKSIIIEKDWNQGIIIDNGFEITITPARHLSGRGGKKNQTLWISFVIKTGNMKVFYSGDSGYGSHFKQIGESYGPFDLAILECGQYSGHWPDSHMMPEETVQASVDLKAEKLLPSHWAKFTLSMHAWDEPIIRVTKESSRRNVNLLHPMIGEKLDIKVPKKTEAWWEKIK